MSEHSSRHEIPTAASPPTLERAHPASHPRVPALGRTDRPSLRRGYLDWLRGLAVLIMIEAHVLDSWTRAPDRDSQPFGWAMTVGGMGAPLFLFLAGVSVALSAGSKARRSDPRRAVRKVMRRGLEIFGLAFLFRIQAWILGWARPSTLLRVDILNIMGPSIVAAAALWGALSTPRRRLAAFLIATAGISLATPIIRAWPLEPLPDPIEAYIRPAGGFSMFVLFPWAGFVFAGAALGVLIDQARARDEERRLNLWFGMAGALALVSSYVLSHRPSLFSSSYFWTTSPAFFFLRAGLMTLIVALAYAWQSRPGGMVKWSPFAQLGRTSLFIYWIHVEMVYGLVSRPIHKALSLGQAWVAYALFVLFMLACSVVKERVVGWWQARRTPGDEPVAAA